MWALLNSALRAKALVLRNKLGKPATKRFLLSDSRVFDAKMLTFDEPIENDV